MGTIYSWRVEGLISGDKESSADQKDYKLLCSSPEHAPKSVFNGLARGILSGNTCSKPLEASHGAFAALTGAGRVVAWGNPLRPGSQPFRSS